MAKIVEENIVIKISSLSADKAKDSPSKVTDDLLSTLESVAKELLGDGVVIEVEKA